VPSEYFLTFFI